MILDVYTVALSVLLGATVVARVARARRNSRAANELLTLLGCCLGGALLGLFGMVDLAGLLIGDTVELLLGF